LHFRRRGRERPHQLQFWYPSIEQQEHPVVVLHSRLLIH
jgi:hypothetical protein